MNTQQPPMEDEINLRDYINVIIKRKKIILTVFFVSIITTAVFSLMMPKVYQATTLIMIVPSKIQAAISSTQVSFLGEQQKTGTSERSVISFPTHKVLLKSNVVLERIIDKLKLTDGSGKSLIPDVLSKRLNINEAKETSILRLEAEDTNPKKAKELSNAWAQEYIKYNQELIFGEVKGAGDFITDQFEISKQNLTQIEGKVKDFKDKYKLDLMHAELNMKKAKLNNDKNELIASATVLKTKDDDLTELKKEIAKQDRFIIVSKAISDDALWQNEGREKAISDLDKKKLRSEELNPIYQNLETRIVNTEIELNTLKPKVDYLSKAQDQTKKEIDELEGTINQREFELTQLTRQVEIYKRTYDNLSAKIEEARITKAAQLGEVKIISPALEPKHPVGPKKRQNVALSGIISLLFGTFLAFFIEFWQSSKQKTSQGRPPENKASYSEKE